MNLRDQKYLITTLNIRALKRFALLAALTRHDGNRTRTAKTLGVSLRTVRIWIDELRREQKMRGGLDA